MASHFRFHSGVGETVPFTAKYTYPSQASRSSKSIVKIPPKNGSSFSSSGQNIIRIEFPADGYLNPIDSFLTMHVYAELTHAGASDFAMWFTSNIQTIFNRVRITYGSLVLEDIMDPGIIARLLSEHTGTNTQGTSDQFMITDGIGSENTGIVVGGTPNVNDRLNALFRRNGVARTNVSTGSIVLHTGKGIYLNTVGAETANDQTSVYDGSYSISILSGLFNQQKLIPLKWLASALTIELYIAPDVERALVYNGTVKPVIKVNNVNYVANLTQFDSTYDTAFYQGMVSGGVPLKFNSWHCYTFNFNYTKGAVNNIQINERARSVRAAFAVIQEVIPPQSRDYGMFIPLPQKSRFQWRLGGKYYPAQQVDTYAEAYIELAKALNIQNNYSLQTGTNWERWTNCANTAGDTLLGQYGAVNYAPGSAATLLGASNYVIAGDFTSNSGAEISGINAEDQSDLYLNVYLGDDLPTTYGGPPTSVTYLIRVFVLFDMMIIVRPNNTVETVA